MFIQTKNVYKFMTQMLDIIVKIFKGWSSPMLYVVCFSIDKKLI